MLEVLNTNKFILGMAMILLNIGSRHLVDELSTTPEEYDRNIVLRRAAIFAVCFVGTRDVIVSLLLTAAFVILAQGVSRRSREGMRNRVVTEVAQNAQTGPVNASSGGKFGASE